MKPAMLVTDAAGFEGQFAHADCKAVGLLDRRILNLGCGRKYVDEAVNVDIRTKVRADLVHDLRRRPWPLPRDHFDEVLAYDVIEHLEDLVGAMEEIHRVSRRGAVIKITTPHFSSSNSFTDPTHRHHLGYFSFDLLTGKHVHAFHDPPLFEAQRAEILFFPTRSAVLNRFLAWLANGNPGRYEKRFAWVLPACYLYFELRVVKDRSSCPA